jgi:hypothetical protein
VDIGQAGWVASSCPAIRSASGSRPHNRATSAIAAGSAADRGPASPASIAAASSSERTSRLIRSFTSSRGSSERLVTSTSDPPAPGSSGRTCASVRALSKTTSTRRDASTCRSKPDRSSKPAGTSSAGTPRRRRNTCSTSPGWAGSCPSV